MQAKEQLADAVRRFNGWVDFDCPTPRAAEWETEYPDWESFYVAANAVMATNCDDWDEETKQLLLYTIARDNEVELVAETLSEKQVDALASASLTLNDRDAKWQLAEQMRRFPLTAEREHVLLIYAQDPEEYVRRIALMVLADLGSPHAEKLAFAAWETGDEYQRMACLHVLARVGSRSLRQYLEFAEQDGRGYVRALAEKINNRRGEYGEQMHVKKLNSIQ